MDQRVENPAGEAIALPLRIGKGAAGLALRVAGQAAGVGLRALGRLVGPADRSPTSGTVEHDETSDGARAAVRTPKTPPTPPVADAAAPAPADTVDARPAAPAHVTEQPELVDSYAEPGAEDGPGASVHVAEPWKGYGRMTADDVVARLTGATPEELAAVELYERQNRGRRTVLTAAGRGLRRAAARGASR
jgi:hypothetical protein